MQPAKRGWVSRPSVTAARVALAPSGLIAAGAGVGIGELAGLPWEATATLGVFGWAVRLLGAVWRRWWRNLPLVTIDPIAVAEPWRSLVRDALSAQQRFDEIVAHLPGGPLHDRLVDASSAVHGATEEVWRVSQLGSSMAAADLYAPEELGKRMRAIQREPSRVPPQQGRFDEEAALAAQLQAIHRRREATARVEVHVRRLVTQLNVAVSDLVGLALGGDLASSAFDSLDHLSNEIGALRQAVGEVGP